MEALKFWQFIVRCLAKSATETADSFDLKMRTFIIAAVLVFLGFALLYLVKGPDVTREEVHKYLILVPAPAVLFLASLFLYHIFRAPYLIYTEEYAKAQAKVIMTEQITSDAGEALNNANRRVKEQQTEIWNLRKEQAIRTGLSKSSHSTPLTSLTDGQRFALKQKLGAYKGHSVSLTLIGQMPQARILFEQLQDIFKESEWNVQTSEIGELKVVGMHILTTSFLTGSNIASPIVGAVFSVFSSLGIELPLAPHTFGQEKAEIIIVIQ